MLENVTRNSVATEDVRITDSVHVKDSIRVRETADTVWMERWRTVWRERIHLDTVRIATHDTVIVESVRVESGKVESAGAGSGKRASKWWIWPVAMIVLIGIYSMFKRQ